MKVFCLYTFFLLLSICALRPHANAQPAPDPQWIKWLKDDSPSQALSSFTVYRALEPLDTSAMKSILATLEKENENASLRLRTRIKGLKARILFYYLGPGDSTYAALMKEALGNAYELNDTYMIAEYTRWYGEMLNSLGNQPLAAQYCMNALKIQQELGFRYFPTVKTLHLTTAEMLYRTMNYPEACSYFSTAFTLPDDSLNPKRYKEFREYLAHCMNTMGRSHNNMKRYDSAIYYAEQCMRYVQQHHLPEELYYIAADNRFDPFLGLEQYDSCRKIANDLYEAGQPNDSATLLGACFMKARIALRIGEYNEALQWGEKAVQYGISFPKQLYQVYKDLAKTCEHLKLEDKALYYLKEYQVLEAANNEMRRKTSASFLEAESEYQKSKLLLSQQSRHNRAVSRRRNILIAAVLLLALPGIVYFYYKRKRSDTARLIAEEQSHFFKTKYEDATLQLEMFKKDVHDKNEQIEKLTSEKNTHNEQPAGTGSIDALSREIILTENDWQRFRENFDLVYPGFYTRLRVRIPSITNAEARMACLIKLNFDARHIAGMLGISPTSVRKTRYRLKKRFADDADRSLEDIIAAV